MNSRRLEYRSLAGADASRIARLAGDWEIASMTARIPFPYTADEAHEWVSSIGPEEFVRGIVLEGELIGAAGYYPGERGAAEIGYWIGRPWWNRGFATEAAQALVRYSFGPAGFRRLTCCHYVDNPRSARVIEKLGFRVTGSCSAYSEARKRDVATIRYERMRPFLYPWLGASV